MFIDKDVLMGREVWFSREIADINTLWDINAKRAENGEGPLKTTELDQHDLDIGLLRGTIVVVSQDRDGDIIASVITDGETQLHDLDHNDEDESVRGMHRCHRRVFDVPLEHCLL